MDLWVHGELDDEPGRVAQDEGADEVPVNDVPQAADAPVRRERKTQQGIAVVIEDSYLFFSAVRKGQECPVR